MIKYLSIALLLSFPASSSEDNMLINSSETKKSSYLAELIIDSGESDYLNDYDFTKKEIVVRSFFSCFNALPVGCAMVPVYLWHLANEGIDLPDSALYPVAIYTGLSYGLETGLQRFLGEYENTKGWWLSQVGGLGNGILYAYYLYQVEAEHGLKGQYAVFFGCLAPFLMVNEALTLGSSLYGLFKTPEQRRIKKIAESLEQEQLEYFHRNNLPLEKKEINKEENKGQLIFQHLFPLVLSPFAELVFASQIKNSFDLEEEYCFLAAVPMTLGLSVMSYKVIENIRKEELKSLAWLQSIVKTFLPAMLAYEALNPYGTAMKSIGTPLFSLPFLLIEQKSLFKLVRNTKEWLFSRETWRLRKWFQQKNN